MKYYSFIIEFIESIILKISIIFENISLFLRYYIKNRKMNRFLKMYNLKDIYREEVEEGIYNSYEATNIIIIEKLIYSKIISKEDNILDVGCGTGLFLLYLASRGYMNLNGIELDNELYCILKYNIYNFSKFKNININVENGDIINVDIDRKINCIYLANPLIGYRAYEMLFENIKESINKRDRDLKIIIFNMTKDLKRLLVNCKWLEFDNVYLFREQICYKCFNIVVVKHIANKLDDN